VRATKGLWAAMGAGVALAAAALVALATMSVVLAVGGWPKGHFVQRGAVSLQAQRATAHTVVHTLSAGSTSSAATTHPRHSGHRAPARHVVRHKATRRPVSSSLGTAKTVAPSGSAPSGSSGGGSSSSGSASRPSGGGAGSTVAAPVTKVTGTVGTTVTDVTNTAGQVLAPVSQPVAGTVTQVGQQAGQTVDQVGQTVGGVVGGLTGGMK
jgi:hypothetical protein